ncbi:PTS mannose/fructose/sorbose transporter subunit IIB [Dolosicoccus paucivorans]|uniref:PTS mannose/fructose/sorbose transporter subunit IIB n=1 Tax=Dolosicoccus paucivorans TaxID=84521 RepID=A0A2N6SPJ8_9LACT|nr:PTS sugar transporter subunit IIB [Dolosicoccus paucivorans]PMC58966.1 PTS mannose/fructose/sorbose transporter subunit IIB [Dolosicoccus paucivorans]
MGIVLARIDQRLVHGIVVTQWTSAVNAQRIMVIDDEVAVDEPRKAAMRMSKPAGTGMSLIDTETAVNNFKSGRYDNHNVLLVVNNVDILLKLLDEGIDIPKVNVGIMLDSDERQKYTSHFAATDEELHKLKEIETRGTPVTIQFAPSDKEEPLNNFI